MKASELRKKGLAVTPDDMDKLYPTSENTHTDFFIKTKEYLDKNSREMNRMGYILTPYTKNYPKDQIKEIKELAAKHQAFIDRANEAAKSKKISIRHDWNNQDYSEIMTTRQLCWISSAITYVSIWEKDRSTFMKEMDTINSYANWMFEEPCWLAAVSGSIFSTSQCYHIQSAIGNMPLSDADLRTLSAMLAEQEKSLAKVNYYQPEIMTAFLYKTRELYDKRKMVYSTHTLLQLKDDMLSKFFMFLNVTLFSSADKAFAMQALSELHDIMNLDYYRQKAPLKNIMGRVADAPPYYFVTHKMLDETEFIIFRLNESMAEMRCARTGIAIELFRRKYGKLPETLSELVPEFMAEVPADPFDGKKLRYVKGILDYKTCEAMKESRRYPNDYYIKSEIVKANLFRVYSIGRDLKDDGGDPIMPHLHYRGEPDVCFPVLVK